MKKPIKYIFLDIDGVLNSEEWYHFYWENDLKYTEIDYDLDFRAIALVNKLIELTNAEIVLSSSWRFTFNNSVERLYRSGLKYKITKKINGCEFGVNSPKRGDLIQKFLTTHKCDNYVIIDDDKDMLETQINNFVYIDRFDGFTEANLYDCVKILNNKN